MTGTLDPARRLLLGACGLLGFFGLWATIAGSGLVTHTFLPGPLDVAERLVVLLTTAFAGGTLLAHLGSSLQRFAAGYLLAAAIGVPLGLLMGRFRTLDDIVSPIFDALRFIAPIAWVPF
ncbi:MAG: ABC transporter permease, partial [Rhizobiales bacterium 35-68-8]